MQLGFLGLGKMGTRIVEKLLLDGHEVVGWNRTRDVAEAFVKKIHNSKLKIQNSQESKFNITGSIEEVIHQLKTPRVIWMMLPAGEATEQALADVSKYVEKGDIVIDGGNAFYKDTQRRFEDFAEKGIRFLGIGVSGGVIAEKTGYPLMAGGDKSAYEEILPILDSLSKPDGGHNYFGTGGAGHFVKMVHNGIEYGMMQAIGEGFGVLDKAPYELNLLQVAENWQKGTIISGFLIDRAKSALEKNARLDDIVGEIGATGEAEWTVNQAREEGVFAENIEQSLDFRRRSKTDLKVRDSFAARMVAALRREFGGHKVKEK